MLIHYSLQDLHYFYEFLSQTNASVHSPNRIEVNGTQSFRRGILSSWIFKRKKNDSNIGFSYETEHTI